MKSYIAAIVGLLLGGGILHAWWTETYTDSALAIMWRRISSATAIGRNSQAVTRPLIAISLILGAPLAVASELGAPDAVITVLSLCFITPLVVGLIYLLPFPLPRLVDAHYQFCKRHNLLDKNGTPLPDDVIGRYLAKYDDCDTNGQQCASRPGRATSPYPRGVSTQKNDPRALALGGEGAGIRQGFRPLARCQRGLRDAVDHSG